MSKHQKNTDRKNTAKGKRVNTNNRTGSNTATPRTTDPTPRPNVLVLEGLSASADAVLTAGGNPVSVSPTDAGGVADALEDTRRPIHALLLTGGGDVNPRLYHRKPHRKVYGVNETRDTVEYAVLAWAREANVPVLGICRGAQIQNIEAGGNMRQHIGGHYGTHPVTPVGGSTFADAVRDREHVIVTSLHHQEIGKPAPSYVITGRAPDGTVEAIESRDGRCLGVQFHPEMDQEDSAMRDIFRWLIVNASTRAGMDVPPVREYRPFYSSPYKAPRVTHAYATTVHVPQDDGTSTAVRTGPAGWYCSYEGIQFSDQDDYTDHMWIVHGEQVGKSTDWEDVYWDDEDNANLISESARVLLSNTRSAADAKTMADLCEDLERGWS